jgi:hypothetical protein
LISRRLVTAQVDDSSPVRIATRLQFSEQSVGVQDKWLPVSWKSSELKIIGLRDSCTTAVVNAD